MSKEPFAFEGVKAALRQSKDGIVLSLVVHPSDVETQLMTDPIGQRYYVTLIPADAADKEQEQAQQKEKETALDHAKRMLIAQAGILCRDPEFQRWFLVGSDVPPTEEAAIRAMHRYLGVKSRSELADSEAARRLFIDLRNNFNNRKPQEKPQEQR